MVLLPKTFTAVINFTKEFNLYFIYIYLFFLFAIYLKLIITIYQKLHKNVSIQPRPLYTDVLNVLDRTKIV